jgi:hypothetical protein
MKKIIYLYLIFIFIIGCYAPTVTQTNKVKKEVKKDENKEVKTNDADKKEVSPNDFVYLFFNKSYFQKKEPAQNNAGQKNPEINPNDFKVIVDWQYEGGRKLRLKNTKTGKEYIITDGEKTGEIILVERALFYYKFKIGNTIIKVKR